MKKSILFVFGASVLMTFLSQKAQGAFIVECVTSGKGFANFSYPGATAPSTSSAKSTAAGCQGTASIFGLPHIYNFKYTPSTDADNYSPSTGTSLGQFWNPASGQPGITNVVATGTAGGGTGRYRVYAAWPSSSNESAAGTTITILSDDGTGSHTTNIVLSSIDQRSTATAPGPTPANTGIRWWMMGEVYLNSSTTYWVTSSAPASFVSQRFQGVMWERVPDAVNPCLSTTNVGGIAGPVAAGQTSVTVLGVSATATAVTVYQGDGVSMIAIGTLSSGIVAGNNAVTTTALIKGKIVSATQTITGQESCVPNSGPIVGGGPNPRIRISASIRQPGGLTGPIGANGGGPAATIYWVKATGSLSTSPVGGLVLNPSTNWQTIVFDPRTDPEFIWNPVTGGQPIPDVNQFGILEGFGLAIDDLTDTGPMQMYFDNLRNGTTLIQDFEGQSPNTLAVLFAKPGNSSTTSPNLNASPDLSAVSTNNSAGGTNSAVVSWQFNGLAANKWVRLNALGTAGGGTATPNPELDLTQPFAIDVLLLPPGMTNGHSLGLITLLTDQTNCPGDNVTWTATATPGPNTGTYTYQWRFNGANIPGETSSTFVTNGVAPASAGKYSVVIGDGSTAFFTNTASLSILPIAQIFGQPNNALVNMGDTVFLSVSAGPVSPCVNSFSYQWRHEATPIPGATDANYSFPNAQLTDWGKYSVVLSNQYGIITSSNGVVNVLAPNPVIGLGYGLLGEYYSNHVSTVPFTGPPSMSEVDSTVDFDWVSGSPNPSFVGANTFTVRWSGQVQPQWAQTYNFYTVSDDGVRLWVNGQLVINSWITQSAVEHSGSITLTTNLQDIVLEYYENTGNASIQLLWESPSQQKMVIPSPQLYPATVGVQPVMSTSVSNKNFVLNWGAGSYPIEWATNLAGPYSNNVINGAISPLSIPISNSPPAKYFRIKTRSE